MENIPSTYQPGSSLTVTLSGKHTITFISEKVFTPFSSGQVIVVHPQTIPPGLVSTFSCDSLYVLKVYDPRYVNDRERFYAQDGRLVQDERPWSLEAEHQATTYRDSLGVEWEENMLLDYADDLEKEVVWELMYYRQTKWAWEDEVAAYRMLSKTTLAGVGVPLFYGAGELVLEEPRAIVPRVLVIEYISDAMSLANIRDRVDIGSVTAWHVKALDDIFVRMNKAGVTHEDVGARNILIGPERAVVIDFGEAKVRPRGRTNKQWARKVQKEGDPVAVRKVLRKVIGNKQFEQLMN
ncbi:hypothetical protein K443DRAFT_110188 [Laccaria amethystina LaAM-08-1]|jgi:hypothetical protein|uniref:Non-specific serine/threonine protein kinase n=1 Tax=Laccaria amethystina LaAM-08-1 TaxID=1095629 RepID=A0A0C9XEM8_9AGAR|nr:hypothetical protein K443DRAFT_110188 [Laccaria amethystina LaAM-08-1]